MPTVPQVVAQWLLWSPEAIFTDQSPGPGTSPEPTLSIIQ
jgi:hypothetical protein